MRALVLCCGNSTTAEALTRVANGSLELHSVPSLPGKSAVDELLSTLAGRPLLVQGSDADLAAVVLRLLRTDRLADTVIGYLPTNPHSKIAELWRIPTTLPAGLASIERAVATPTVFLRDDVGGVLLGEGRLKPAHGIAYCDDQLTLRGQAQELIVTPDTEPENGLTVKVIQRRWLRAQETCFSGRALQVSCHPTTVWRDGHTYARLMDKWTWYRHTEDLLVLR